MGTIGLPLILVVGFVASVSGSNGNYFFVVAPNMMRFEHPETVMVSVFGAQKAVRIWLSHKTHKFSEHTAVVNEDSPQQVEMLIREEDLILEEQEQKPRTIMLNADCDGMQRQKEILIKYSSGYIFVQTSQPVYVPRQKVQIRYLALTESMHKVGRSVNVSMDIISPKGDVFLREHKTTSEVFYQKDDFELPPNCDMGIWTIKVYFRGLYQTESRAFFEVREYVVPTFGVDVTAGPNTILPDSTGLITVTVTAKYVYGKPVDGRTDLKVYLSESDEQTELMAYPMKPLNAEGVTQFEVDIGTLKRNLQGKHKWFPEGQRLKLMATTSEGATLNRESGINAGIVFSKVPYIFKFTRSKKYFRYLRKYYLKVDVTLPNGDPAYDVEVKAGLVHNGRIVPCTNCEGANVTDRNGQMTLIFPTTEGDFMVFQANNKEGTSPSEEFIVEAYKGRNQILAEHVITSDGSNQVRAFNNMHLGTSTGLTSMIISRGKILESSFERQNNEPIKVLSPHLQEKISPSGRFIVFYVDSRSNEVVADSIKLSVTPRCKGQDIHMQAKQLIAPGDSSDLRVSGQPGTYVGLSVLDKAILLLNNKNILHKNKLFEELDSHDIGCGNGGGRNSAHVFSNAGLTVITDANMDTETRDSVTCEGRGRRKRSTDCSADQRCCEEGEKFAMSLFEIKDRTKPVDKLDCYSRVRELAVTYKQLSLKCLLAFFHSCAEYVQFENEDDGLQSKSGDSDYETDLREIEYDEKLIYVRKNFRESFEFNNYRLGEETGEINVKLKYPDSITEWMIQAIGLTPSNGVCISEPLNVTAFRDFFIQLDLPYQAVRMEHIDVKATVFVYGESGSNSTVSVYMDGVQDLCSNVRPGRKSNKIVFAMQPNSAHTVRYPIIPLHAPKYYPIKITAILNKVGTGQTDAIEKSLYVVNEGEEKQIEVFSCLDPMKQLQACPHSEEVHLAYVGGEKPAQALTVDLTLPAHIKGTGQGTCYIYSDNAMEDVVQAVLIQGVEKWIQLPTGCVEQTIIRLAPLVYAMKYLKLTKQVTEKIEQDGNSHIRAGVNREHGFKKSDNSYPPYDRSGSSTWLTAFISKVFCQAKKVVDDSVDESVHVTPTINWLTSNQNGDGSYTETNFVNHGPLMGLSESGGPPALTAFILIAMQECRTRSSNVEIAIKKAMAFLEGQDIDRLQEDPYALAIISYALAISNSTKKMTTYEHLEKIAQRSRDGMMYWGWPGTGPVEPQHIEATSYALLAQLQLDDLRSSNETVRWLSLHRSSGGAFKTTQDTVIGLQALSEYNIRTYRTDIDLTVKLMSDYYLTQTFKVNKDTSLVQKIATDLPVESGEKLQVEVTGKGTGNIRCDLRYNVEKTNVETCPFEIDVVSSQIELDETAININKGRGCDCGVCPEEDEEEAAEAVDVAFGPPETIEVESNFGRRKRNAERHPKHCTTVTVTSLIDTTGMVTIEIGLETGMTVLKEDLEALVTKEKISMYELPTNGKGFFVLYINKMFRNEEYKYVFTLEDTAENVFNRQASYVRVIDYYNPDARCQTFYGTGTNLEPNYKAQCDDDACKCLLNTCPKPWKEELKAKFRAKQIDNRMQGPADFLVRRTCDRQYAEYAVLVEIEDDGEGDIDQKELSVQAKVVKVFNQGKERQREGMEMNFFWRMDCQWPAFRIGRQYYIIARDGMAYTKGNETMFKYYIGEEDIVLEWKPVHTPVGTFMIRGYERYWEEKQCPK